MITIGDETMCLNDWVKRSGLKRQTVQRRINAYGWSPEEALSTPPRRWGR
jgi:hypothetical protein